MNDPQPYSLTPETAAEHFGIAAGTLYNWVSEGCLIRGQHYLKIGRKTLIVRDAMIEYLRGVDNGNQDS